MKKDFFNGKIKREFVSYIRYKIIIAAVMFFGMGVFFLYFYFFANLSRETRILVLLFAVVLHKCESDSFKSAVRSAWVIKLRLAKSLILQLK